MSISNQFHVLVSRMKYSRSPLLNTIAELFVKTNNLWNNPCKWFLHLSLILKRNWNGGVNFRSYFTLLLLCRWSQFKSRILGWQIIAGIERATTDTSTWEDGFVGRKESIEHGIGSTSAFAWNKSVRTRSSRFWCRTSSSTATRFHTEFFLSWWVNCTDFCLSMNDRWEEDNKSSGILCFRLANACLPCAYWWALGTNRSKNKKNGILWWSAGIEFKY